MDITCACHRVDVAVDVFVLDGAIGFQVQIVVGGEGSLGRGNHINLTVPEVENLPNR